MATNKTRKTLKTGSVILVAALPDRGQQQHKNMHNKNAGDRTNRITVKMFVCLLFLLFVMLLVACLLDCLLLMLMPWVEPVVVVVLLLLSRQIGYLKASVFKSSCPRRSTYRGTPFKHFWLVGHLTAHTTVTSGW